MAKLEEGELGLVDSIKADYAIFRGAGTNPTSSRLRQVLDILTWPGFISVVIFRSARAAHRWGLFPVSRVLTYLNLTLHSTDMSPRAVVGPGLLMLHPLSSGWGPGVRIGRNVRILHGVVLGAGGFLDDPSRDGFPVIGDDVILCDGVTIFGPVTIGARSIVGAGVRLTRSVPEDSQVVFGQRVMVTSRVGAKSNGDGSANGDQSTVDPSDQALVADGHDQGQRR